ncbi:3-demethylubiquinone-9 3-methyltransferase [Vibrio galatheae]|uniref:3-demethylubiquinone-9 3-methyltransferase n=1 Tax=Vibrio galatheae TaxID=579748 RepID=A0A0F4NS84_9VIBR|nr:3-demethylubiquinone-9 3-methyltransferase [Vibrio galatheae]
MNITQLREDFYAHIRAIQACALPQTKPTLSLLTDEELRELEACWIALSVWKNQQD